MSTIFDVLEDSAPQSSGFKSKGTSAKASEAPESSDYFDYVTGDEFPSTMPTSKHASKFQSILDNAIAFLNPVFAGAKVLNPNLHATDIGKDLLKSGVIGIEKFAKQFGPTLPNPKKQYEELRHPEQKQKAPEEVLEDILPTPQPGPVLRRAKRFVENVPTNISFPGAGPVSTAVRTALATSAGETVKELGGGEGAQALTELGFYIGPDVLEGLIEKGKYKEIIQKAREKGLSDKEIVPALQSEAKQRTLSAFASKGGKGSRALKASKDAIGRVYNDIESLPIANEPIHADRSKALVTNLKDTLFEIGAGPRSLIQKDYKDLISKPITGKSIINFIRDINREISGKGISEDVIGKLKGPLYDELKNISPDLYNDLKFADRLYGPTVRLSQRLKPTFISKLLKGLQILKFSGGLFYTPLLVETVGEQGVKLLTREMLLNPKLQQLGVKFAKALNENKNLIANKLFKEIEREVKKDDPDGAKQLREAYITPR